VHSFTIDDGDDESMIMAASMMRGTSDDNNTNTSHKNTHEASGNSSSNSPSSSSYSSSSSSSSTTMTTTTTPLSSSSSSSIISTSSTVEDSTLTKKTLNHNETLLLPEPLELLQSFINAIHNFLYDIMMRTIYKLFYGFPTWNLWIAREEISILQLPTFSLQPSGYMAAVCSHLITLVQQLEPHITELRENPSQKKNQKDEDKTEVDTNPESNELDSIFWLSKVEVGIEKLLLEKIPQIPRFTEKGARQLAVDIESLSTVLPMLSLSLSPFFSLVITFLQSSKDELVALKKKNKINPNNEKEKAILVSILNQRKITDFQL